MTPIPAGFRPLPIDGGFVQANGPLYGLRDAAGFALGLPVEERHCNMRGVAHGGMVMTLADMVVGFAVAFAIGGQRFLPTVSLSGDFVAPAPLGCWLEGRGKVVRAGGSLGFAECTLTADGAVCFRGSGILKVPREENALFPIARLFEPA